ncbi:YopX family protein [Clostridium sp.]|uniref:YopX family protein n=1 Tax=Clostridium sp. TaxID=1506 RepID=UPI00290F46D7|nr:YopX family protein [Clostridium sp.]MDU3410138.1 YopX family protein [Clostridium sp.]
MREIEFRGKSIVLDSFGEILYGDLHKLEDEYYIYNDKIWTEVDEKSVGQYTGRKDKNGKKIYEGDFLAREGFWSVRIEWEDTAFVVRDLDKVRYNNLCFNWYLKSFDCSEWEVIGNIYENPELQNK